MMVSSGANEGRDFSGHRLEPVRASESAPSEVCLAVDLDVREDTVASVTRDGRVLYKKTFPVNGRGFFERCEVCLNHLFSRCRDERRHVLAIGVSTKGEVRDGVIQGDRKEDLRKDLERKFRVRTEVLNRFHAAAFGVFHLSRQKENSSVAVITISHGVGSGVIKRGVIQETYDAQKGTGGLLRVQRKSTGKMDNVAKIAGIEGVNAKARDLIDHRATLRDLYEEITRKSKFKDKAAEIFSDAQAAVGELVVDIDRTSQPDTYLGLVYDETGCAQTDKQSFFDGVRRHAEGKLSRRPTFEVATCSERDAKLVGVAMLAIQRSSIVKQERPRAEAGRFIVTGLPGSGKTTFASSLVRDLREKGIRVGGMMTHEIREHNQRTGFYVQLLSPSGQDQHVELARIGQIKGWTPMSRYSVSMDNIDRVIVPALEETKAQAQVIVLDEVGGMQLLSRCFRSVLDKICALNIPTIITLPEKSHDRKVLELQDSARREHALIILDKNHRESSQARERERIISLIASHEQSETVEGSLKRKRSEEVEVLDSTGQREAGPPPYKKR